MKLTSPGNLSTGNNLEDLRRFNLSTVLKIVHQERSISRSDLSKRTGLNRSTIFALIGELNAQGLVNEISDNKSKRVGRPSTVVVANQNAIAIAVNPESDAVTIGVIGLGGYVHKQARFETNSAPTIDETLKITNAIIEGLTSVSKENFQIIGIGLAIPELIRKEDGLIGSSHHLEWKEVSIIKLFEDATGLKTSAGNEAFLSTLAEQVFGSGIGIKDMVFLNGGASGIAGGIISSGQIIRGYNGYAGEMGHTRITLSGEMDSANVVGTIEAEISRTKLLSLLNLKTADYDQFDSALRNSKSPNVLNEVGRQMECLALAISNFINLLNPQLIILGGFLGTIYSMDTKKVHNIVAENTLKTSYESVRISRAALGVNQVILGAAELVFQTFLYDPAGPELSKSKIR